MSAAEHKLVLVPKDAETRAESKRLGLAYWMREVLAECDRVRHNFSPDPVHDLRVELRRCRSLADGLMTVDSHPAWKRMKKASKPLFASLGNLRDVQVMTEWVERLESKDDPVSQTLLAFTSTQEQVRKNDAVVALGHFDPKQWEGWSELLPKRASRVPDDSLVFRHLALERWSQAHELHNQALRNRTKTGFHRLRIGLKKFRYTVENFLPQLHEKWESDLKHLQDLLGEVHDLDVLWAAAVQMRSFPDEHARLRWREKIEKERHLRLQQYRQKMVGSSSLWGVWRAELPQGAQVEAGALQRMETWASLLDPDFGHARKVARLAIQLYDGLAANRILSRGHNSRARSILQAAALMHDVGRAKRPKKHHKVSARWIRRLTPPYGWTAQDLQLAGLVARYHRGSLPTAKQQSFAKLSASRQQLLVFLAGILRLAEALDWRHRGRVRGLEVEQTGDFLTIWAQGNLQDGRLPEKIAGARHLLEVACDRPIIVRAGRKPDSDRRLLGQRPSS